MKHLMNSSNSIFVVWCLMVLLANPAQLRDPVWVLDITNYGKSGASQASASSSQSSNNSNQPKLTTQELKDLYKLGQDFRKEYVDDLKFLPSNFDPNSVYLHTEIDQPSMIGAYAFALGAYPDNISYLDINRVLPSSLNDIKTREKEVRSLLGLSEIPSQKQSTKVPINTENGYLYWRDPTSQCPIVFDELPFMSQISRQPVVRQYLDSTSSDIASRVYRATNKLQLGSKTTIEQLMSRNEASNGELDYNILSDQFENLAQNSYFVGASTSDSDERTLDSVKHSHFFTDQTAFSNFLRSIGYTQANSVKIADNIRFEIFATNGKHYVRSTLSGKSIDLPGSKNGVIDLQTFLSLVYSKLYITSVDDIWVGQEDPTHNLLPQCQKDSFINVVKEVKTVQRPRVVERCHLEEKVVEATAEHKVNLIDVGFFEIVQVPKPQVVYETRVVERPVPVDKIVTHEVHVPVEVRVPVEVPVPVIEEKVVLHEVEKVVAEPPTHLHHIKIETPEKPTAIPALQLFEEVDSGWPWWIWLLPLLCCIPCWAWLLCRKPKPKPAVIPKQPMAPVQAKKLTKPKEREIMAVKTEERHSPERKYVIERKIVDEGEAIEMEIEKELRKSRAVRETRAVRAVSAGRQTAAEIATEGAYSRGAAGRTRRIKTIK